MIYRDQRNLLRMIETWDRAEKALADALNAFGKPWQVGFTCFILLLSMLDWISICLYQVQ